MELKDIGVNIGANVVSVVRIHYMELKVAEQKKTSEIDEMKESITWS